MSDLQKKKLSLKENLLWNTGGCLIYQGCQWLITIVVVIFSSNYTNSGVLAFAMAIGNIFFPLATYNMRTFQVSDVKNEYSSSNYVAFRIVTVGLACVLVGIYIFLTSNTASLVIASLCWMVFKADESFCNVLYGVDQKQDRMDYIGISQGLRGVLLLVFFSGVLITTDNIYFSITAMSLGCIAITGFFDITKTRKLEKIIPHIDKKQIKKLFVTCFPAAVTLIAYGAVVSVARQNCGSTYGEELLGVYAAVATPTVIVQVAASYIYSPILVPLSRLWHEKNKKGITRFVFVIIGAFVGIFSFFFILAYFFGPWLLHLLFGSSIDNYAYLLLPALVATACSAFMGFCTDMLILVRRLKFAMTANLLALLVSIFSSSFLLAQYGLNGVNITIILSFSLGFGFALIILIREYVRL